MTRQRLYGQDVEYMAWLRGRSDLPSSSPTFGLVATDVDAEIHVYKTEVDSVGTREVQSLMRIEVKSRGGQVAPAQRDTLWKLHSTTKKGFQRVNGQAVRNWGVSFVLLSGTTPDNSAAIGWGRFDATGKIVVRSITVEQLIQLHRFDLHPDLLTAKPFRRHHKTRHLVEEQVAPLGFKVQRPITLRS